MIFSRGLITQKGEKSISSTSSSLIMSCDHSAYAERRKENLRQLCVYLPQLGSKSGAYFLLLVGLTSSIISCFSLFYYPRAKVQNVSDASFDWNSEAKY